MTIQSGLLEAIEWENKDDFLKLEGNQNADLNFAVTKNGIYPLMIIAAKGK